MGKNIYFQSRIQAGMSRESASEMLGISVSSLANYERGATIPPQDIVLQMAATYHAPEIVNDFCMKKCPLGVCNPVSDERKSLEIVTLEICSNLDCVKLEACKNAMLRIAEDGKVEADEAVRFAEIGDELEKLYSAISDLRLYERTLRYGR